MNKQKQTNRYQLTVGRLLNSCVRSSIDIEDMPITYRTYDPDGNDIFAGMCKYHEGELIPCDGDLYSLEDVIDDYQMFHDEENNRWTMTIWYQSEWETA